VQLVREGHTFRQDKGQGEVLLLGRMPKELQMKPKEII
jgi:hypothetical protein